MSFQNNYDAIAVAQVHHQQAIAPPPPYHIAILLPGNFYQNEHFRRGMKK